MSPDFIIKSTALDKSVDDVMWQDYGEDNSDRHGSDGNSENEVHGSGSD
jgi:hypothetical protein